MNQSFASLGRILGPFLGSVMFTLHASRTLPFVTAVGVLVVVAALSWRLEDEWGLPAAALACQQPSRAA